MGERGRGEGVTRARVGEGERVTGVSKVGEDQWVAEGEELGSEGG